MTKEEVIIVAVQWWSDKLMSMQPHSNGDNSVSSVLACMFADMRAKIISKEQINIFENALTALLDTKYDMCLNQYGWEGFSVSCDYAPDTLLCTAASKAGIDLNNFPYKTRMLITKSGVSVSDGYGKPYLALEA